MNLSPEDLAQLDAAIRLAFQPRELERTLKFRLGRNLVDLSLANNFRDVVFDVLEIAGREGWLEGLVKALRAERPDNQGFCRVADELLAGSTVGRTLTPERLVRLAVVLGDLVEPELVASALASVGRSSQPLDTHRSLQDFLITELMRARQQDWAGDFLKALAEAPLPEPADAFVAALVTGDTAGFDEAVALEASRAQDLWRQYVTRPGILSRTSEFRRIIERRAADRALARLDKGLYDWEQRICLVRYRVGEGPEVMVTGFLVGPDLVLFSGNVLAPAGHEPEQAPPARVECLFDYSARSDGTTLAQPTRVLAAASEPLASSPPSKAGFLLYRLQAPIGDERGWASLDQAARANIGDPVMLVHHAEGGPLRMSIGSVRATTATALTYDAPTAGGASGAPVLSDELGVLAIHHRKVAADGTFLKQGTPIPAILATLEQQGIRLPGFAATPAAASVKDLRGAHEGH